MRLLFVILLGAILRFTNLDWDGGGRLHPDEALIVNGALSIQFFQNLFPGYHDYNGLSAYILRLFSPGIDNPIQLTLAGRFLSALLSTLTIPLVFFLGKKLWNKEVGMFTALLFTFTPLSVQLAHFYTTESILVFLFTLLLLSVVSFWQHPSMRLITAVGITSGLLLATKNTSYLFLPVPFLALSANKKIHPMRALVPFVIITTFVFFLTSPYSFLDVSGYIARSRYLSDVVNGNLLMDWTMQFQQTNGLFWIPGMLIGMGVIPLLGIVSALGLLINWRRINPITPPHILALWSLGFLVFLSMTYLKFIRYSAPLMPVLALLAAKLLYDLSKSKTGKIFLSAALPIQIVWAVMCFHIYLAPHPAHEAATWLADHVPAKSTILREEWNSIIHFDTTPLADRQYNLPMFNFYTLPDTQEKISKLTKLLITTDYIVLESPKIKNTILRQKNQYPRTSDTYKQLEMETLGFVRIAEFTSYPQLGPLVINDEAAEETWYAFDHPTVTIYQKK